MGDFAMRRIVLACAVFVLSGPASAQEWGEFRKPEENFSVNFPGTPKMEDLTWTTAEGAKVPARIYSAQKDTGRYILTIADYASRAREIPSALAHAANVLRKRGRPIYDDTVDWDGVPGYQVSVVEPDGRVVHATMLFYMDKLFIAEGSAAAGAPPAAAFHQSLAAITHDGRAANLQRRDEQLIQLQVKQLADIEAAEQAARVRPPNP
jgi:hypothetical protein